jgi:hypothetical protein
MPETPRRPEGEAPVRKPVDVVADSPHALEKDADGVVRVTPGERARGAHRASRSSARPMVGTSADGSTVIGVGKVDAGGQGRVFTEDDLTMTQGIEPVDRDPDKTDVIPAVSGVEVTAPIRPRQRVQMPRRGGRQPGPGK